MTARKVGTLALAYLSGLVADANEEWPVHRNSKPFDFALADLRALMAESERRQAVAEKATDMLLSAREECARLRAALEEADASTALYFNEVAKLREESARVRASVESALALLRDGKRPSVAVCAAIVHLMSTVEERSGAAASTAGEGVKP